MNNFKKHNTNTLSLSDDKKSFLLNGKAFTGIAERYNFGKLKSKFLVIKGLMHGLFISFKDDSSIEKIGTYFINRNGYFLDFPSDDKIVFIYFDMDNIIELISVNTRGERIEYYNIINDQSELDHWNYTRKEAQESGLYHHDHDILPYFKKQNELAEKIILENHLPSQIKYIAGADVAYDEENQIMAGCIVTLDANSYEIVDEQYHIMEITFPYVPGLFSFRETPPLIEAYNKLKLKPDIIVCDGHGIAHPKGVGMATHLGIELDIPTIGCAKTRLVGSYKKENLGKKRGSFENLVWDNKNVGVALRTQDHVNPVFVSPGHKIDLSTSIEWILKLCPQFRLPETTRAADHLVRQIIKTPSKYDFYNDEIK